MAITFVQAASQNDNNTSGTTSSKAFSSNNTAGNILVLTIVWTPRANTISSITDTLGNTWTPALATQTNNNSPELSNIAIYYVQNAKAGSNTVTITWSSTGNFACWTISEFSSGIAGTWTVDKTQFSLAASASTSPSSGATATLSQTTELVVGIVGTLRHNETFTAGSGFTIPTNASTSANNQSEAMEWQASTSTAAKTATMTLGTSSTWNAAIATFIPPSAIVIGPGMMLGLG